MDLTHFFYHHKDKVCVFHYSFPHRRKEPVSTIKQATPEPEPPGTYVSGWQV